MRLNLFFIDFNCSGDCLFVFLHYIFHGLFPGLVTRINQKNRPFFKILLSKCAQFSGRYLPRLWKNSASSYHCRQKLGSKSRISRRGRSHRASFAGAAPSGARDTVFKIPPFPFRSRTRTTRRFSLPNRIILSGIL